MLLRVKKSDAKVDTFVKPDGVAVCLDYWSTWMGQSDTDLGIKGQASLRGDGDGYGNEDTSNQRLANEIAEATNAMIGGLRTHHRWAIYRACGLATMWKYPNMDLAHAAEDAKKELEIKLRNNVATRILFC